LGSSLLPWTNLTSRALKKPLSPEQNSQQTAVKLERKIIMIKKPFQPMLKTKCILFLVFSLLVTVSVTPCSSSTDRGHYGTFIWEVAAITGLGVVMHKCLNVGAPSSATDGDSCEIISECLGRLSFASMFQGMTTVSIWNEIGAHVKRRPAEVLSKWDIPDIMGSLLTLSGCICTSLVASDAISENKNAVLAYSIAATGLATLLGFIPDCS
jgi:hypothetical protein